MLARACVRWPDERMLQAECVLQAEIPGNLILSCFMMGLPGGRGVCGGSCLEPLGRRLSWFYPSLGEALALGTHHEHALLSIGTSDALRPACSIRASGHLVCMRSFGLAVGLACLRLLRPLLLGSVFVLWFL